MPKAPFYIAKKIVKKDDPIKEIGELVGRMKDLEQSLVNIQRESAITLEEIKKKAKEAIDNIENKVIVKKGDPGESEKVDYDLVESKIQNIVDDKFKEIPKIDKQEITDIIDDKFKEIPKIDEGKLIKKIVKQLPDKKGDLKIIKEQVEVDPMSIIDKIMSLPDEHKDKLFKNKLIDGMQQTIRALQSQLGRGYLHGGGVPSLTEGTNITLTRKSDGGYVISAVGSSQIYTETPSGLIDGVNVTYTTVHDITNIISFAINGQFIHKNQYSFTGNTITFNTPIDSSLSGTDFDIVYS